MVCAELKHRNKGAAQHDFLEAAMQNHQHVSSALNRLIGCAERPFDLHALLQSTSRTLSNLDFAHQHEVQRLERGRTDAALKKQIIDNLKRRHRERRQPYVALIAELQSHLISRAGRPSGSRLIRPYGQGLPSALMGASFCLRSTPWR
jgi:hypothetical protein